jgi:hypothetical protein
MSEQNTTPVIDASLSDIALTDNSAAITESESLVCIPVYCTHAHETKPNEHVIPVSIHIHDHNDKQNLTIHKTKYKNHFNVNDDKTNKPKTVQQIDEEKLFISAMKPFITQAVIGTFMVFLTNSSLDHITGYKEINPLLMMFLRIYLNACWHGYGKKDDPYIVTTFNKLFEHEIIKRVMCLIDWIDMIGKSMINAIDLDESIKQLRNMNISEQRNIVTANIQIMYAVITSELTDLKCTNINCITSPENVYDGGDIFITDK